MATFVPTGLDDVAFWLSCQHRAEPHTPIVLPTKPSRVCRYCKTAQYGGEECNHCGAPDNGVREPLMMAPMGVPFA